MSNQKTMQELRDAFKTPDKKENEGTYSNSYYPFWNMKVGESCVIRFLPDANDSNPKGFLAEKKTHTLTINGEKHTIPCLKMYEGEDCPICKVSSDFYNVEGKGSPNGKKYYRSIQHVAQVLVMEDPLPPNTETGETHKGKVRYITLGFKLYNIIKAAMASGEFEVPPYYFKDGCNFTITKSQNGDWAAYDVGSTFSRKLTDLPEDVISGLDLVDLSTLLPRKPDRHVIEAMLSAALNGATYTTAEEDTDHPVSEVQPQAPTTTKTPAPVEQVPVKAPVKTPTPVVEASSDDDEDLDALMEQLNARRKAKEKVS